MIITLDLIASQVSIDYDSVITVIDFTTISASDIWTSQQMISVTLDNVDPDTMENITMSFEHGTFLRNIVHHIASQRSSESDYYNERNIYKLWRLLNGETNADIEPDLQNIESQRMALESAKSAYRDAEDAVITEHVAKMDANTARAEKEAQLNAAQYNYDSLVIILSGYDSQQTLTIGAFVDYLPAGLQSLYTTYSNSQFAVNALVVSASAKTDELNKYVAVKAYIDHQIDILDPEDPNYASKLAALEAQTVTNDGNIDASSNDLDAINFNLNTARGQLKIDEAPFVSGLQEFRDEQLALVTTYTAELVDMPYYENLGAAPEKTELPSVVSEEMRRMLYAVSDEAKPNINLRNVSPELVYQAYDRRGEGIELS